MIWDGKIVYLGSGCVVQLIPTHNTADGFAGIYGGLVRIKSPVTAAASTLGTVCLTVANSVIQQRLDFTEINSGNLASYGVLVSAGTGTSGLQDTEISIQQIHGSQVAAVQEGTSTGQANQFNRWKINNIETFSGRGIDTWGAGDNWNVVSVNGAQGTLSYAFVTESTAQINIFTNASVAGATSGTKLDTGTNNMWIGAYVGVACSSVGAHVFYGGIMKTC